MEKGSGQTEIAQKFGVAKSTAGNTNKNGIMNMKDS
jgi:hypothetical protein